MPREINTWPRGLVDLLKLKEASAFTLEDSLRSSIESFDLLSQERYVIEENSATVVEGDNIALQVPPGQIWFVYAVSCRLFAADATDVLKCRIRVGLNNDTGPAIAQSDQVTAANANDDAFAFVNYERPFVLRAGDFYTANVTVAQLAVAADTTMELQVLCARFGPESTSAAVP